MISKLYCTQENHVAILQKKTKKQKKNIKQTQSTRKQEKNRNNI